MSQKLRAGEDRADILNDRKRVEGFKRACSSRWVNTDVICPEPRPGQRRLSELGMRERVRVKGEETARYYLPEKARGIFLFPSSGVRTRGPETNRVKVRDT